MCGIEFNSVWMNFFLCNDLLTANGFLTIHEQVKDENLEQNDVKLALKIDSGKLYRQRVIHR